ncbi:MAG: hypothetical protein WCO61_03025 [Alphaproteobacteria bacterium]
MNNLVITLAVWGERYRNRFLNWTVKSLLSNNNIPRSFGVLECTLLIITTSIDREEIDRNRSIKELKKFIKIQYEEIKPEENAFSKYSLLSNCHDFAINFARIRNSWLMITNPDSFYSDGSILELVTRIQLNQTCVMSTAISVDELRFEKWLYENEFKLEKPSLSISSRDLIKAIINSFHTQEQKSFFDSTDFTVHPSQIHWRIDDTAFLSRIAHRCPILIKPSGSRFELRSTYDDSYLEQSGIPLDKIEYITDSDKFLCAHIVGDDYQETYSLGKPVSIIEFAKWLKRSSDVYHRHHLNKEYIFHCSNLTSKVVKRIKFKSHIFILISKIISLLPHKALKMLSKVL